MFRTDNDRSHIAWDIDTTGFAWDDEITVSGFWFPRNHATLILNTNSDTIDLNAPEDHLQTVSGGVPVTVKVTNTETGLLEAIRQLIFEVFDREYNRLIAFNAEVWKGGFDLPFIRTRCFENSVEWVFDGVQFADLWDVLKKRINTTHTAFDGSTSINSLTGAHAILFGQAEIPDSVASTTEADYSWYQQYEYDPFADSGSAAAHYREGKYISVLQHNLADIHRTWELGELIRTYVSSKDFTAKKL